MVSSSYGKLTTRFSNVCLVKIMEPDRKVWRREVGVAAWLKGLNYKSFIWEPLLFQQKLRYIMVVCTWCPNIMQSGRRGLSTAMPPVKVKVHHLWDGVHPPPHPLPARERMLFGGWCFGGLPGSMSCCCWLCPCWGFYCFSLSFSYNLDFFLFI